MPGSWRCRSFVAIHQHLSCHATLLDVAKFLHLCCCAVSRMLGWQLLQQGCSMKIRGFSIGVALLAITAGCATTQKFKTKMDGFIGQPEIAVVSMYGPPQGAYTLNDGSKVIQYTRGGNLVLPGATTYQPVTTRTTGNLTLNQGLKQTTGDYSQQSTTYIPTQAPATNIALSCTVTFTIDLSGIVQRWAASGNHCVSQGQDRR